MAFVSAHSSIKINTAVTSPYRCFQDTLFVISLAKPVKPWFAPKPPTPVHTEKTYECWVNKRVGQDVEVIVDISAEAFNLEDHHLAIGLGTHYNTSNIIVSCHRLNLVQQASPTKTRAEIPNAKRLVRTLQVLVVRSMTRVCAVKHSDGNLNVEPNPNPLGAQTRLISQKM